MNEMSLVGKIEFVRYACQLSIVRHGQLFQSPLKSQYSLIFFWRDAHGGFEKALQLPLGHLKAFVQLVKIRISSKGTVVKNEVDIAPGLMVVVQQIQKEARRNLHTLLRTARLPQSIDKNR